MAKVTLFAGLCGSGKTYESKQLEQQYSERGEKVEMFREVLGPNPKETDIIQKLKDGVDCIVEEAFYCVRFFRDRILQRLEQEVPKADIQWECFENNLEDANWNVQNRPYDDAEAEDLVKLNTEKLHPNYDTGDITTKPIFRIPPKMS